MPKQNLTAAIIGGGKSRRFGEPKALARFKGKRLIDYAVELALQISPRVFLVNGRTVAFEDIGIPVICDIIPDIGPIGGLYTALSHSKTPFVAALPVDTPLLTVDVYSILYRFLDNDRPVVALSDKGLEPLISIWPVSVLSQIQRQISSKNYSLRDVFQLKDAVVVDLTKEMDHYDPNLFLNINYKKDLQIND